MRQEVGIIGAGGISALGSTLLEMAESFDNTPSLHRRSVGDHVYPIFPLSESGEVRLKELEEEQLYSRYDRATLMAILASRDAALQAGWKQGDQQITGVCIGSARGATGMIEYHHENFLKGGVSALKPHTSPTTTGGSITSPVSLDLALKGPTASLSMTCSSGLYSVAQGAAFLRAGMVDRFLVGGTEAPLTPFTLAQMGALRIYSKEIAAPYPCRPLASDPKNTLTLGEGAAALCLELVDTTRRCPLIVGIGFGAEMHQSATGMSPEGAPFQQAMSMALRELETRRGDSRIDLVIMHAPGTIQGDASELAALDALFDPVPPVTSTKFLTGHTFGASGPLGILFALLFHKGIPVPPFPYDTRVSPTKHSDRISRIMINSAGFGGNAVSLILEQEIESL